MDQARPWPYGRGSSSNTSAFNNSPGSRITAKLAASIDSLYLILGGNTGKDEIETALKIAGGNADFAYDVLITSPKPERRDQQKMIEDHAVLSGVSDMANRDDVCEIIKVLPLQSSRYILAMYNHCRQNKQDTISRILDDYAITTKESNKLEGSGMGKGKGKDAITEDRAVKSELLPERFGKCNPFTATPRASSSESEDLPAFTPGSSFGSSSQSPKQAIAMRPAAKGFNELADNLEVPATKVETDSDEDYQSDIDMNNVKNELENNEEEEDDIYGLFAKDRAAGSESGSEATLAASDSDVEDNTPDAARGNGEGDVNMTLETSNREEETEVELSDKDKQAFLKELFPKASRNEIERELTLNEENMEAAAADLEIQFGLGGSEAGEQERSVSPGIGPSRARKPENHKRRSAAMDEGRQSKRVRCDKNDEGEDTDELDAADKWVLKLLHSESGIQIELDSGVHPCKIADNFLRYIPGFRIWLDENPARAGVDRTLKVSEVSLETFNLAMQWAVCSTGRLTRTQRRSKTIEVTAFVDLAIFASTVNLSLGKASATFMTKLKALLVKHRDALKGVHIAKAFKNLEPGHQVCNLLVQASIRPYAEFQNSGDDRNMIAGSGSESESESESDADLNSAQRAAYRRARFCFNSELKKFEVYRTQLLDEFHHVWWGRINHNYKHSRKHLCSRTSLTDPLTDESFEI
ncbi:hypothetical protein WAI453_013367 [Rhynchosporium graminicola]|uniref:CUE domain-containing protein n=1 Tax=Rhynchosporium graminicola TaxID=2792576 RepID=A0A1E1KD80_9HELO|nr:uncharacterized protein RCO7_06611 [Rhynchosporium commune]